VPQAATATVQFGLILDILGDGNVFSQTFLERLRKMASKTSVDLLQGTLDN
jgi:hypothetical protein